MEPFSIRVHLTKKEYRLIILKITLTRPIVFVLLCLFSIMLLVNMVEYFNGTEEKMGGLLLPLVYLILFPAIAYISSGRTYDKTRSLIQGITYTFSDHGVNCVTEGIDSNIAWDVFMKVQEKHGYILLYTNRFIAHIIPLSAPSPEQLAFIRHKTARK